MNFVPVTGAALNEFDERTVHLYRKRQTNERSLANLFSMVRDVDRNHLPVVAHPVS